MKMVKFSYPNSSCFRASWHYFISSSYLTYILTVRSHFSFYHYSVLLSYICDLFNVCLRPWLLQLIPIHGNPQITSAITNTPGHCHASTELWAIQFLPSLPHGHVASNMFINNDESEIYSNPFLVDGATLFLPFMAPAAALQQTFDLPRKIKNRKVFKSLSVARYVAPVQTYLPTSLRSSVACSSWSSAPHAKPNDYF